MYGAVECLVDFLEHDVPMNTVVAGSIQSQIKRSDSIIRTSFDTGM
jgi:hypothetical protein